MAHQEIPPSREEWQEWRANPVTRWYFAELKYTVEDLQDGIATGGCLRPSSDQTAFEYAKLVGITQGSVAALLLEPPSVEAK